jgi:hypothetical protein
VPLASSNQSEDVSRLIDLFDRFYASPKAMGRNNIRDTLKREFLDTKDDAGIYVGSLACFPIRFSKNRQKICLYLFYRLGCVDLCKLLWLQANVLYSFVCGRFRQYPRQT